MAKPATTGIVCLRGAVADIVRRGLGNARLRAEHGRRKPFLLEIGLPVPDRCTLSTDGVGGQRICFFVQGVIEMEVTDWNPPTAIGMKITRSTLPGRRWLTFVDAEYEQVPEAGGTRVTRRSTIASRLYPRWY